MSDEIKPKQEDKKIAMNYQGGSSNPVYGLGMIGAWVFYIGRAATFQEKAAGFFKGLFWPAFLVHDLLEYLNKE